LTRSANSSPDDDGKNVLRRLPLPAQNESLWLLWNNRTRMHSTLNDVSPMQIECGVDT
jgi:hypothetical protein